MYFKKYLYFCIYFILKNTAKMEKKKYKRKQSIKKTLKEITIIKNSVPKIVFTARNIVVTLRNKSQLKKWLDIYPEGEYQIN